MKMWKNWKKHSKTKIQQLKYARFATKHLSQNPTTNCTCYRHTEGHLFVKFAKRSSKANTRCKNTSVACTTARNPSNAISVQKDLEQKLTWALMSAASIWNWNLFNVKFAAKVSLLNLNAKHTLSPFMKPFRSRGSRGLVDIVIWLTKSCSIF